MAVQGSVTSPTASEPKRLRHTEELLPPCREELAPVSRLDEFKAEFGEAIKDTVTQQLAWTAAKIVTHIEGAEERLDAQHNSLSPVVYSEQAKTDSLANDQRALKVQVETLRAALPIVENKHPDPPHLARNLAPERLPDPAIIRVRTKNLFYLVALAAEIELWLDAQKFDSYMYDIKGETYLGSALSSLRARAASPRGRQSWLSHRSTKPEF
jgi:hypothetical protein